MCGMRTCGSLEFGIQQGAVTQMTTHEYDAERLEGAKVIQVVQDQFKKFPNLTAIDLFGKVIGLAETPDVLTNLDSLLDDVELSIIFFQSGKRIREISEIKNLVNSNGDMTVLVEFCYEIE